ncbi:hypothetical protein glysoja_025912 [Glycine soja]|uniref:Uncharacterized protein n=1 Tax=Glycine soja TaxID=3848 RepID=A0A0B2SGD0_GLYSO|nr:hypothetical protein glysoja_025912 [Glycine soja]
MPIPPRYFYLQKCQVLASVLYCFGLKVQIMLSFSFKNISEFEYTANVQMELE